ncbi:DUF2752 domain-containing protein [Pedobacter montanisoli]|uniref:DUF2752 domain-containing protein n=1 Tax=Pedobacter montanisoli TaxID=2923277 RepID=UPI00374D0DC4
MILLTNNNLRISFNLMFNIKFLSVFCINLSKTDIFLFPCPIKYITGIDCPGCGFQRSVLALLTGNLTDSFLLYPATIPFIASLLLASLSSFFKVPVDTKLLRVMYFVTGGVISISYLYKIFSGQIVSF